MKEEKWNLNSAHAMHWCLKNQSNQARYMFCKIYLNFTEQYSFKVDRDNIGFASMTSHYWYLHIQSLIVATWTIKSHVRHLMFYFMQPLDFYQHGCSGLKKDVQWTYNMVHGRTDLIKTSYGRPSDERCPMGRVINKILLVLALLLSLVL